MPAPHKESQAAPVLSVRRLSKSFGSTQVLHNISFDLLSGEIHAIVGENGCGKSTFIKCLAGYHQPSPGSEIRLAGHLLPASYGSAEAFRYGFAFVHQNLGLVPTLSVVENLALSRGFDATVGGRIRWNTERGRARRALAGFGAHIDPDTRVGDLAQADKTLVAIARGLDSDSGGAGNGDHRIVVLDEPTAALPAGEVDHLFSALRRLAARGAGLIYISHRLSEILKLADRVTAMRDGRVIATVPTRQLDERALVDLIIGRSIETFYPKMANTSREETLLEVEGLSGNRIADFSFAMKRGEILGIAGLLGSGRSELGRLIFGAQRKAAGAMRLEGRVVNIASPKDGLSYGIGYIPEDRLGKGGVGRMTLAENLTLPDLKRIWSGGRLHKGKEKEEALAIIRRMHIRPADPDARFSTLSGGNQQKAIIARSLRLVPRLLILDEPVQGVDIGSKVEIYGLIERAARDGASVIVIDSDFEDLCRLCDRVLVLRDGRLARILAGAERTRERISELVYMSRELS